MAKKKSHRQRENEKVAMLQRMIRQATKTGATEAIEHCHNFWQVGDGYKKYIDNQIKLRAEALLAAVTVALRKELAQYKLKRRKRPKP